jgi:hypothetical protein
MPFFLLPALAPAITPVTVGLGLGLGLGLQKEQAKAPTEINAVNKSLLDIDLSVKQNIDENCLSQNSQKNVINVINSKLKRATAAQKNELKLLCALQSSFQNNVNTDIQNKVAAAIAQTANASGGSIGGGKALAENITKVYNEGSTYLKSPTIIDIVKKCILDINQDNIINLINANIDTTDFNQVNQAFKDCAGKTELKNDKSMQGLFGASLDIKSTAEATAGDPLGSSAIAGIISSVIVLILISILVPVFLPQN